MSRRKGVENELSPASFLLRRVCRFFFRVLIGVPVTNGHLTALFVATRYSCRVEVLGVFVSVASGYPADRIQQYGFVGQSLFLLANLLVGRDGDPDGTNTRGGFFGVCVVDLLHSGQRGYFALRVPVAICCFRYHFHREGPCHVCTVVPNFKQSVFSDVSCGVVVHRVVVVSCPAASRALGGGGVFLLFRCQVVERVDFVCLFSFDGQGVSQFPVGAFISPVLLGEVLLHVSLFGDPGRG